MRKNLAVSSYRLGEAASVLGISPDALRRWVDAGRVHATRTAGGQRVIAGTELAVLAQSLAPMQTEGRSAESARNRLPGIVTRVTRDGVMAQVEMQAGPHRIVSLMTREASDDLGLAPGVLVVASVKSTNVVVATR